jgi:hypothetical protein
MVRVIVFPLAITAVEKICSARETGNPGTFEFIVIDVREKIGLGLGISIADIDPEGTPADAVTSVSVRTVMPVGCPAVAAPIVRPPRVMMTGVEAPIPTPPVAMMI